MSLVEYRLDRALKNHEELAAYVKECRETSPIRDVVDLELAPSLADEFFRRGVQDCIGTAWSVDDTGAVLFATTFYETLLAAAGQAPRIGDAVLAARTALAGRAMTLGTLWAACQHYGDPQREFQAGSGTAGAEPAAAAPAAERAPSEPEKPDGGIRKRGRRRRT